MAEFAAYDFKPDVKDPVFVVGLPGIGMVGRTAADFAAEKLGAKRFARIFSQELPAEARISGGIIEPVCHSLWHAEANGKDIIFLLGSSQASTPQGMFSLSEYEFRIALGYGPVFMAILCGYGTDRGPQKPRVIGAASDPALAGRLAGCGIDFSCGNREYGVAGAAGLFAGFGTAYGIETICLMGETSGKNRDAESAASVVRALSLILGTEIDASELEAAGDKDETDL